jgi:GTP-binding protein
VIINKVDRPTARVEEVKNEIFDLFCDLEMSDDLLDYPILYASGRDGWAIENMG